MRRTFKLIYGNLNSQKKKEVNQIDSVATYQKINI